MVIATTNDTVYSLNARDGSVEWKNHLAEPVSGSSLPCGNVDPVGITSTPVIDTSAGRIYAVGMVRPGRHMLFALDLETGHLRSSKRVDANGADPAVHNQRGALLLSEGKVFVPFGGRDGDCGDYHGRVVSVDVRSADLGTVKSYTLPTKGEGGFWAPPGAVDAGDGTFYLASGNSSSDGDYDYGNSVVRLTTNLALRDSFAPTNWVSLNNGDVDLGSSSPVLLSGNRIFQIGKAGTGYILDAADLGGIGGARNSAHVCSGGGWGGIAHNDDALFVPCSGGIVQVTAQRDGFDIGWTANLSTPGPTIVTAGAVWSVATDDGVLVAVDPSTGKTLFSQDIGRVPSRFTSPAAAGGRVFVAADRKVLAFGG